jgi:uncharacterized protein (DUF433 family)
VRSRTRISGGDVLDYLAAGMTEQQTFHEFPQLTGDDIPRVPGLRRGT